MDGWGVSKIDFIATLCHFCETSFPNVVMFFYPGVTLLLQFSTAQQ